MATAPTVQAQRSEAYFRQPRRYLAKAPRIQCRLELVKDLIGDIEGKRVLDLGCGNGAISAAFANRNSVTMVDISPAMIAEALEHPAEHVVGDLNSFTGRPADVVLCIGILSHVDSTEPVIAAIARNLTPGGRFVLQLSDSAQPINRFNRLIYRPAASVGGLLHYRPMAREDVLRCAERFGLRLVGERQHFLVLPGMQSMMGPLLIPYDRALARSRLARFGSELLLLLSND